MITANELKTQGVKAIEKGLKKNKEVGISVRGKLKYVTMTIEQYEQIRLLEPVSYTHLDVYKRQGQYCSYKNEVDRKEWYLQTQG